MSKRKDRIYDGTVSSLSPSARILYFIIRFATNRTTKFCFYHDDTLIEMSGLSIDSYYYAKKELKRCGIINYESHRGKKSRRIVWIKDAIIIKDKKDETSQKFGEVEDDKADSDPTSQKILEVDQKILNVNQNILETSQKFGEVEHTKNADKANKDKPLYDHTKTPSVPSSLNISIISSKGDFSRNSEEEKRIRVINEAMDYIKRLNQETDINRKALYIKRLPDFLNRVPEKDRKSLSEMIR